MNESNDSARTTEPVKNIAMLVYALQAVSVILGLTLFVAIIINYLKKDDVKGTFVESHFRWQIRTFWFGALWMLVGLVMLIFYVGWLILLANGIWFIYRIIKGWLALNENKPMYHGNY